MKNSTLIQLGGIAAISSAILLVVGFLIHPAAEDSAGILAPHWVVAHGLLFLACILGLIGWIAIYTHSSTQTKLIGFIGFIMIFLGLALLAGITYAATFIMPSFAANDPAVMDQLVAHSSHSMADLASLYLFTIGIILFSLISFATKTSRFANILLILGSIGILVGNTIIPGVSALIGLVLFGLGYLWRGVILVRG